MLAVLDIALQTTRYRQRRKGRGQRGGEMGGGQKQDTTTVHAPIRKDALPHARNVAPAKHATVFGSSLKAPGPAP